MRARHAVTAALILTAQRRADSTALGAGDESADPGEAGGDDGDRGVDRGFLDDGLDEAFDLVAELDDRFFVVGAVPVDVASREGGCPTAGSEIVRKEVRKPKSPAEAGLSGGAKGNRTPDLLDANETRYQLRYSPVRLRGTALCNCSKGCRETPNRGV